MIDIGAWDTICKMTAKGCSRSEIAKETKLSAWTVWKYQKKLDLV